MNATTPNNTQQHATITCNRVGKRTQHVTSNDVMSVRCLCKKPPSLELGRPLFSILITRSGKCFCPFFFYFPFFSKKFSQGWFSCLLPGDTHFTKGEIDSATAANTTFIIVIYSAIEITTWTTQFLDNFQYIILSVYCVVFLPMNWRYFNSLVFFINQEFSFKPLSKPF